MAQEFDFGDLNPEFLDDSDSAICLDTINSYDGPERRSKKRRLTESRRANLRFEPGKCMERRSNGDRRHSSLVGVYNPAG